MTEDAEDHEIFDINDFTTASEWERFIVRIEEIITEWKLNSDIDKNNVYSANAIWKEKSDTVQFADTIFTISRHYLEDEKLQEKSADESNKIQNLKINDSELDDQKETASLPPRCMADLIGQIDDFKQNLPILAYWYGLHDYLVIYPTRANDSIMSESKANILLSSVAIAINNTGCTLPIFVQVNSILRNMYIGLAEGSALKTHFQVIHFSYIPATYAYLSGLLEIFKSKLGAHLINPSPLIFISVRFTYLIQECVNNSLLDIESDNDIVLELNRSEYPNFKQLHLGAIQDVIDTIYLSCIWPSLSEDMIIDSESYTDLDPIQSSDWSLSLNVIDEVDLQLTNTLQKFYDQLKRTISVAQIVGTCATTETAGSDDYKLSLEKLTNPISGTQTHRSLRSFVRPVVDKATNKMKQLNSISYELPLSEDFLDAILIYIFPDADTDYTSKPCDTNEGENETIKRLLAKCNSIKSSSSFSGDNSSSSSVLHRLAICIATLNVHSQTKAVAQIWNEFLIEIRHRWEKEILICGMKTGVPDLSRCLLHQKLQLLNCCIEKKIERSKSASRVIETQSDENNEDEFFDCIDGESSSDEGETVDAVIRPDGRLKPCGDLMLLNKKQEPLYIPVTQESTPMTEDMLEEHASVLVNLGNDNDAALLRAKIQSASLLSDMESFKAANPGCVLEDFVRWYSPRDFVETETVNVETNEVVKKYDLSNRMKIPGNMWVEVWTTAKAVPVRKQKRLFDDTKEAEKVFEWLNSLNIGQIIQQLLPILFHTALITIINESKDIIAECETVLDHLVDRVVKISRNNYDIKRYQDVINQIKNIEKHLAKMQSLKKRFKFEDDDNISKVELNKFLNSLLKSTLFLNSEVKVENGAHSNLGKSIIKLCKKYSTLMNVTVDEEKTREGESSFTNKQAELSVFKRPYKREYVLRCSAPRPAPYSRQSPQRMYCLFSNNEFRIAGAFTEDTMFF